MSDQFSRERLLGLFTSAPKAFWRHDVDLSLDAAVKMARFAQIAGVQSTFYLNPRCDWYNLANREGREAYRAIIHAGHDVGLHCDLDGRHPYAAVRADRPLLGNVLDAPPTDKVSFHMPDDRVLWKDFIGFENAYASEWEGRYLSDSRGAALNGNVTDDKQINLHPEHWDL
jgi:hypothetical protein